MLGFLVGLLPSHVRCLHNQPPIGLFPFRSIWPVNKGGLGVGDGYRLEDIQSMISHLI